MHRTLVQYVGSGWRRAGLLLANFFPFGLSLVSVPEVFAKVNSTQFPWRINLGYLPFAWENRKFRWENQMVHAILFGKFWKIWPVIEGDNLIPKCHSVLPLAVGDLGTRL